MKCLITGFEPFGNETANPSWEAVQQLPDVIDSISIIKRKIPTVFHDCFTIIQEAIETHQPDFVICVGQAGGRAGISIEKVAINLMDARIPDNAGYQPIDEPILKEIDTAYFSTLPVQKMIQTMMNEEIPAYVSYSAGTYVCNYVMYRLLEMTHNTACLGGFIHVPYATHQVMDKASSTPSMSLETMTKGLECAIRALANHDEITQTISLGTIQ